MASRVSKAIDDKMKAVLAMDKAKTGPLTMWNKAVAVLTEAGLIRTEQVNVDDVLCHPDNRGKLGISGVGMHHTGHKILKAGADKNELKKSTAFEMHPFTCVRGDQILFNQQLVERSQGYMAPINGKERLLSVSSGHTTGFCRAVKARCKTPVGDLADDSGNLTSALLDGDATFSDMCSSGWEWRIISWEAEESWPKLPDLAQRALNAANSVASQPAEPEVMVTMVSFMQEAAPSAEEWKSIEEATRQSAGVIGEYIEVVGQYVRQFAGGPGAPMVFFLDTLANNYGKKLRLGKDFLHAVTNLKLDDTSLYPFSRTALLAANIAGKGMDGIGRFLVPADVAKLRSKDTKICHAPFINPIPI